ncbi:MAG TPA: immune inhibitor A domain-containing protein [Gaiellaceae bacterium]|nr:immune inhibitor A domain-containing protein [Gaiellaceae bacterium]
MRRAISAIAATAAILLVGAGAAYAASPTPQYGHVLPNPLAERQNALHQKALEMQVAGDIPAGTKVGKVAKGQYVKLQQTGEGRIFAILAEFGDQISQYGGDPGPLHGAMAKPDRSVDNTNIWFSSYEPQHYYDLYFDRNPAAKSVANWYAQQSSGRFSFTGNVTDWVKVPYNEARYGTNACSSTVCSTVWALLRDASNQWVQDQLDSGQSIDQIKSYLATFDVEDRYDSDGDGNFEEPDGYIDHFQLLHAGADEAVGGGAQGTDAIWSHRWYSNYNLIGVSGPGLQGGFQIGAANGHPTGFWVGDYVMEPENGGVGVIAHETGHDYGLPDEYDTSYVGEASSAFWTIMSSGSYGADGTNGIGNWPIGFSAWDKFQLGWLNYEVADSTQKSEHKLGPATTNTKQAQGLFVILPQKAVQQDLGTPYAGEKFYYSGSGNDLNNFMTRSADIPAAGGSLTAKVRYDIEPDWDYAGVVASTDGGSTWQPVNTNLSTETNPNGQNIGHGITGKSAGWVDLTADLSAYAGQSILVGFRYWTDVAATYPGISIDEISIAGGATDGAETDTGWTFDPADGFRTTTGSETQYFNQYYVVENRQYLEGDDSLRTGPYNFGWLDTKPDWVEHFPYQDGVLVSYWDTSQTDNNVGAHPGEGLILPIDVHPDPLIDSSGKQERTRHQVYDATLTTTPTDAITLHHNGVATKYPSLPAVTAFDDRNDYTRPYYADGHSDGGAILPATGTQIRLQSMSKAGFAQVEVSPAK